MANTRQNESKACIYVLLGVVVGATGIYFFMDGSAPESDSGTLAKSQQPCGTTQ